MAEDSDQFLTPRQVAKQLRVRVEKVVGWIRRAELRAVNVGDGIRHQYRVSRDDLQAFLNSREIQAPPAHRRRLRQPPKGGPLEAAEGKRLEKLGKAKLVGGTYYRVHEGIVLYL
jgi:excisionase family DNA binding protein